MSLDSVVVWCQHHLYTTLGMLWLLSNVTNAMPSPNGSSGKAYRWFYGFMHATFGMVPRLLLTLAPSKLPAGVAKVLTAQGGSDETNSTLVVANAAANSAEHLVLKAGEGTPPGNVTTG